MRLKTLKFSLLFAAFFLATILSFFGFLFPGAEKLMFSILLLIALAAAFYRLEYGLLILSAELFVGSFGYLFSWPLGAFTLSWRMVLWASVLLAFSLKFLGQLFKDGGKNVYWQRLKHFSLAKYFALLALFVLIALINGLARGHSLNLVFSDFNAWLFFLLLFPVVAVYGSAGGATTRSGGEDGEEQEQKNRFQRLALVFLAAALWLGLETLGLLFIFSHNLPAGPEIYAWLRKTLLGEMTLSAYGWPRVFMQSQIFPLIGLILIFWRQRAYGFFRTFLSGRSLVFFILAALFWSTALISLSRSFWAGLTVAFIFSLIFIWRRFSCPLSAKGLAWLLLSAVVGFLLLYLAATFPYPRPGAFRPEFLERLSNTEEAAATSRWSLLPALSAEIAKTPLFGQGFGATVTYFSRDPRVLAQNPTGLYTTYAFEWGYLGLWLKLGLLGLFTYFWLLFKVVIAGFKKKPSPSPYLSPGLASGIIFLAAINVFSPYLNHPLGIIFLLISSCLILADRVY